MNIFDAESDARELEALAKDPVDLRKRIRTALVDFSTAPIPPLAFVQLEKTLTGCFV